MGLAVSGHSGALQSSKLEPGVWMLELQNWIMEPRSQKLESGSWKLHSGDPGPFWEIEAGAALRGASNAGPANPLLEYINRYIHYI